LKSTCQSEVAGFECNKENQIKDHNTIQITARYEDLESAAVREAFKRHKTADNLLNNSKVFYILARKEAGCVSAGASIP